ncbi:hypothetical protein BVC93_20270 [Mycobacterium sp. MS1601]|uniref:hypothetical protein n=1 Tax=Mycobacterium sp. MS1601 TaxID=1936029 RepID=UPI0009795C18|nr:hypothetical protein [Mycobacterium sp. MS1601]AQA04373.1 hypothetical protein BVC93_20270 [Mycobacterium sp. MS1601]
MKTYLTNALCCDCATPRTVSASWHPPRDANRDDAQRIATLRCRQCGAKTRHALVCDLAPLRDDLLRRIEEAADSVTLAHTSIPLLARLADALEAVRG